MTKNLIIFFLPLFILASGAHASEVTGVITTGLNGTVGNELSGTVSAPSSPGGSGGGGGSSGSSSSHSSHSHSSSSHSHSSGSSAVVTAPVVPTAVASTTGEVLGAKTYAFSRDLFFGISGPDVVELQTELIAAGYSIPDGPTNYFGSETRAAVASWQAAKGVMPSAGYFGPLSRAKYMLMGSF